MIKVVFAAIFLSAAVAVSGCSFTPVYADHDPSGQMSLAFALEDPSNRMEQIIYQDIALRFFVTDAPNTPELEITARSNTTDEFKSAGAVIRSTSGPGSTRFDYGEVTVTATATATYKGKVIFTATRRAAAGFSKTSLQVMADLAGRQEAEERAAKSVAESLRLAILAKFPTHQFKR